MSLIIDPNKRYIFLYILLKILIEISERNSRPNTPVQSDTEFEVSQRKDNDQPAGQSWDWGQLPNAPKNDMANSINEEHLPESEGKCFVFINSYHIEFCVYMGDGQYV